MGIVLACLQQGEDLEELVVGAVPAGEHRAGVGLPHKEELAGEEVLEVDELGVVHDRRVGLLLEREQDIHAEAVLPPSPLVRRPHDPLARPRDDHEPLFGQEAGEAPGQIVQGIPRLHPRGSEDGDLPLMPVLPEEPEGIAHLLESAMQDLQVQRLQPVLVLPEDRADHVPQERRVRIRLRQREQRLELLSQEIVGNRGCGHRRCLPTRPYFFGLSARSATTTSARNRARVWPNASLLSFARSSRSKKTTVLVPSPTTVVRTMLPSPTLAALSTSRFLAASSVLANRVTASLQYDSISPDSTTSAEPGATVCPGCTRVTGKPARFRYSTTKFVI